jgi:peptide/nickel transport system substrate-binding protein
MISRSKWLAALSLLIVASFILGACQTETIVETVEVPVEVEVEKPVEVEVLITPTPEPIPQGGFMVEASFADADVLNPLFYRDSASADVLGKIFLGLLRTDEFSGETIGELAESWTVSEDGLTFTFKMREDVFWTDGTPVTAHDYKFSYDAIASELVETPRKPLVEYIESINVVDDYTVEVVHNALDCTAILNLGLWILPSHMYAEDFSDVMDNPLNEAPTVTNGPFKFQEWVKDDHHTLVRNDDYYLGAPNMDGWIFRIVADQSAELAAFLAGEVDLFSPGNPYLSIIEGGIAKGEPWDIKKFFDDGYTYVGFNMGNPENPELGWVDENENELFDEGEPPNLEQEPHPILGDKLVRQAIAYTLDYTNIINKVAFGQGAPQVANVLPAVEWAYNTELEPYALDVEKAAALLDEAGWMRADEESVRMKDGKPLELRILTNAGNETRESIAAIMKDNLDTLGFDITLDILEWGTVLGQLLGQQFDMVIIGWTNMGSYPEDSSFFSYRYDEPEGGFNFVSYYNEEMEKLLWDSRGLVGCDAGEVGAMYGEIQEIFSEDVPYAILYNPLSRVVWNTRLQEVNPGPWATYYNVENWYIAMEP